MCDKTPLLPVPVYVEDTEYLGIYKQRYIKEVFTKPLEGSGKTLYSCYQIYEGVLTINPMMYSCTQIRFILICGPS